MLLLLLRRFIRGLPGASMRSPARGKGHEVKGPGKGESGLKGASLGLLVHLPPKPESACFITVLFTLLIFSGKKLIQGFSLLHQLKPL